MPPKRAASSNTLLYSKELENDDPNDLEQMIISPAKMDSFKISKELHSGVCNHGKPHANFHIAREGEHLYRDKRSLGEL